MFLVIYFCPQKFVSQLCEIGFVLICIEKNKTNYLSILIQSYRRNNYSLFDFLVPHLTNLHLTSCRKFIQPYVIDLNILKEHKLRPAGLRSDDILRLVFGRCSFRISRGYRLYWLRFIVAICSVHPSDFLNSTLVRSPPRPSKYYPISRS
jgi:hypothetical protein